MVIIGDVNLATLLTPGERYVSASGMLIAVNAMHEALVFDTNLACVEPLKLYVAARGTHLGFATQRPERDVKRGHENLWGFGGQSLLSSSARTRRH